jgi:maltooligosyltrehalose trehalohydrolase
VLGPASFVLRYFSKENDDRLLVVNFGGSHILHPAPEPLLAPPLGHRWETLWTSDSPRYGGAGAVTIASDKEWLLPSQATIALQPVFL